MIRPLRQAHRAAFLLLGVGLPVLFFAALSARPPWPAGGIGALPQLRPDGSTPTIQLGDRWLGARIDNRLWPTESPESGVLVQLSPREPIAAPDPLLYWSSQPAAPGERLPANARFLSPLGGSAPRLVELTRREASEGFLLVISGPGRQVLAAIAFGEEGRP